MNSTLRDAMEPHGTHAARNISLRALATHRLNISRARKVGMFTERMEITPEFAAVVLEQFAPEGTNRSPSRRNIELLSHHMRTGRWNPNSHQGIAFRTDGVLADGQHRLHACIDAGVSFTSLVTYGQPADVFTVLDQGAQRTAAHLLQFAGIDVPNRNNVAALARFLMVMEDSARASLDDCSREFDKSRIVPFVNKNEEAICNAVRVARNVAKGLACKAPITGIAAAFYMIQRVGSPAAVSVFADGFAHGAALERDCPILVLRETVRQDGAAQGYRNTDERNRALSASIINAWNLWRGGRAAKSFKPLAFKRGAPFPEPRA